MSKSRLRVLWFTNTPANGIEVLEGSKVTGSWLSSLDRAIRDKVELTVAFYYARFVEPFQNNGVNYYPICKKNWRLNIIKKHLVNRLVEKEELRIYLDIISVVQPDIIHIHGTENPFGSIIHVTDLPVVVSIQGICSVIKHKYFSGIERNFANRKRCDLWPPYNFLFNKSYTQIYRYFITPSARRETKYLRQCKHIIGRTDWDRRITRVLAPKSKYFHNDEILRESFYEKKWGKPNNKKVIIHTTCSDAFYKGFETICYTIPILQTNGWNIEWRVAGVGTESLLNIITKQRMSESYPKKGLELLGGLNEEDLVQKMLEADIYVMPSHIENSSNSLCEAMILGMPCIATYAGGTSSLMKDKEEGLLIQDGDPWSMAGAIHELLSNEIEAIEFGKRARERALIRHDKERIVSELLAIYKIVSRQSD